MELKSELDERVLNFVAGGEILDPGAYLKSLGLDSIVRYKDQGFFDHFFYINENGHWKEVGSKDMIYYLKNKIGIKDPRYVECVLRFVW